MMRALMVIVLLSVPAVSWGQDASNAADAVRAADAARVKAFTSADVSALRTILADDLTYVHSSGKLDNKTQIVEALQSGQTKYLSIEVSDLQVRVYGTAAVVNGQAAMRVVANGETIEPKLRFTSVYVLRDGRWQFAAWQSTRLPAPAAQQ